MLLLGLAVEDAGILFTELLELGLEAVELLFRGKFGAELLALWLLVADVVGGPGPGIVAGLHLLQLAEDLLGLNQVVEDALVGFLRPHQHPDQTRLLVLQELELAHSSLLPLAPPSIDFGFKFGYQLLLLLAGDHGDLGQVVDLVGGIEDLLLGVVVLVDLLVLFLIFNFGVSRH